MKFRKNQLLLALFLFFVCFNVFAQNDFRAGYIVNVSNDTIQGFLDYKGDKANAKKCLFKKNENATSEEFTPGQLKSYRFENSKLYVTKNIEGESEPLFLEYLVDGIVDVYYYRGNSDENYLIDKGDGKLNLLKNEKRDLYANNKHYVRYSQEYIGVLKYTFQESESLSKKAEDIKLSHKSLIKLASDYHYEVCTSGEECLVYEKKLPETKTTIGGIISFNSLFISKTDRLGANYYYLNNSEIKATGYPSFGFYLNRPLPYLNERLSFQYEGTLSYYALQTESIYIEPSYSIKFHNKTQLKFFDFNNSGLFRYKFHSENINPVFIGGGFFNFHLMSDFEREIDANWKSGEPYLDVVYTDYPFNKYDVGLIIGFGLMKETKNNKSLSLDIRYQRGLGLRQFLSSNYLSINLGIQLGK